jgi:hypothetical protein
MTFLVLQIYFCISAARRLSAVLGYMGVSDSAQM